MDEQLKELSEKQEKTFILVQKLWRAEKWRRFWSILRYVILTGIVLGAFYFLTPYIEKYLGLIQSFQNIESIKNPQDLQNILKQLQ